MGFQIWAHGMPKIQNIYFIIFSVYFRIFRLKKSIVVVKLYVVRIFDFWCTFTGEHIFMKIVPRPNFEKKNKEHGFLLFLTKRTKNMVFCDFSQKEQKRTKEHQIEQKRTCSNRHVKLNFLKSLFPRFYRSKGLYKMCLEN